MVYVIFERLIQLKLCCTAGNAGIVCRVAAIIIYVCKKGNKKSEKN